MTLEAERVKLCKRGALKVQGARVRRVERGQRALATVATLLEKVDLEIEAHASWRMLTYADVCWRMLTYADVC
jgi:hypothetical protein